MEKNTNKKKSTVKKPVVKKQTEKKSIIIKTETNSEINRNRDEKTKQFTNGNTFWRLRTKHGRDRVIQDPLFLAKASDEYFLACIENPIITIDYKGKDATRCEFQIPKVFQKNELARFCGLTAWSCIDALKAVSSDFLKVVTHIEGVIADQKFQYAAANIFNSNIVARDLGLQDKKDITSAGEKLQTTVIVQNQETKAELDKLIESEKK